MMSKNKFDNLERDLIDISEVDCVAKNSMGDLVVSLDVDVVPEELITRIKVIMSNYFLIISWMIVSDTGMLSLVFNCEDLEDE